MVLKRLYQSKQHRAPVSLSRLARYMDGKVSSTLGHEQQPTGSDSDAEHYSCWLGAVPQDKDACSDVLLTCSIARQNRGHVD